MTISASTHSNTVLVPGEPVESSKSSGTHGLGSQPCPFPPATLIPNNGYIWQRIVFGNPYAAFAYLDECRNRLLDSIPADNSAVPETLVAEWLALVKERDRIFQEMTKLDSQVVFERKLVKLDALLSDVLSSSNGAYTHDPIIPLIEDFSLQLSRFLQRHHVNRSPAVKTFTKKASAKAIPTADASVQTDTRTLNLEPRTGKEPSFWNPTATSTPLKCLNSDSSRSSEHHHTAFSESPVLAAEASHLTLDRSRNPIDLSGLHRSFSVPADLDVLAADDQKPENASCASSTTTTFYSCGTRAASVSNLAGSVNPFGRHLSAKVFPVIVNRPLVELSIANEVSNSLIDHNESVD